MASSFKARVNKLKSTRVSVSQKSDKSALETPLSNSIEEDTLKAWIHSTNNINNISSAITRIESDVNIVKSDRERVIKLEVELEKLMQLLANKDYFKNIFMEMLENIEDNEPEEESEWKKYIDSELNSLLDIFNTTHSNIKEMYENFNIKINFLEEQINLNKKVGLKKEFDNFQENIYKRLDNLYNDYQEKINTFEEAINKRLDTYHDDYQEKINTFEEAINKRIELYCIDHNKDVNELKISFQKDISNSNQFINEINIQLSALHKDSSELNQRLSLADSQLIALKQDHMLAVSNHKNDIEIFEKFKNKQKKINELFEENSDNLEKIKKENINIKNSVEIIENITKETSTIFVTKVSELADHTKKLDGRMGRCESYSKDLGISLGSIKDLFDEEKNSLSKIISNLKDDFVDLHERCDHTLSTIYRNDTQHIIDKYVFEMSQLNLMFESSKTMQRENNYFRCIGNLSTRLDKIEQKIN